jgi:hypothetical protein
MPSEADTCRTDVVPRLQTAGWDDEPHSIAEQRTITDGRIVPVGKGFIRRAPKRVDYLLRYTRDFPLAVVEAKAAYRSAFDGLQQAKQYAEMLGLKFAYATNGKEIVEFDYFTGVESAQHAYVSKADACSATAKPPLKDRGLDKGSFHISCLAGWVRGRCAGPGPRVGEQPSKLLDLSQRQADRAKQLRMVGPFSVKIGPAADGQPVPHGEIQVPILHPNIVRAVVRFDAAEPSINEADNQVISFESAGVRQRRDAAAIFDEGDHFAWGSAAMRHVCRTMLIEVPFERLRDRRHVARRNQAPRNLGASDCPAGRGRRG